MKQAIKALKKTFDEQGFTQDEQDRIEWFNDEETDKTYKWFFILDGRKRTYVYNKELKKVVIYS